MLEKGQEFLRETDPEIFSAISEELERQRNGIELIASENFVSRAVLAAMGSVMTNKYAEGYPHARYYGGCHVVDKAEDLARDRAKELFCCDHVNVQPHSGSQANMAVYFSVLQPGDTILAMNLARICGFIFPGDPEQVCRVHVPEPGLFKLFLHRCRCMGFRVLHLAKCGNNDVSPLRRLYGVLQALFMDRQVNCRFHSCLLYSSPG
jgi:hypothetical protein